MPLKAYDSTGPELMRCAGVLDPPEDQGVGAILDKSQRGNLITRSILYRIGLELCVHMWFAYQHQL